MTNVNTDSNLGFNAVGLWHKINAVLGDEFDSIDILTVHPDPNAWGPFMEVHDISRPLDELKAIGYVREEEGRMTLYFSYDPESECDECGGWVRAERYCAGCGLGGS